jgi:serine/threonine-protein kinase HipA
VPGAVVIVRETDIPASAGPLDLGKVHGFKAPLPEGAVKFSLAGVQLKFTGNPDGDRLTAPARGETGRNIIKLGSERFPNLPEAEFAAMQMASAMGVRTGGRPTRAQARQEKRDRVMGIVAEKLRPARSIWANSTCNEREASGPKIGTGFPQFQRSRGILL